MDRLRKPEIGLVGDAAAVLRRLTAHLGSSPRCGQIVSRRAAQLKDDVAADLAVLAPQLGYLKAIRDVLPDNGVVHR